MEKLIGKIEGFRSGYLAGEIRKKFGHFVKNTIEAPVYRHRHQGNLITFASTNFDEMEDQVYIVNMSVRGTMLRSTDKFNPSPIYGYKIE